MPSALEFRVSVPQYLMTRTASALFSGAPGGLWGGLRKVSAPALSLPGPEWVMLEPIASGICGTDLAALAFVAPKALEPFCSFPAIMGHEVLARVTTLGSGVESLAVGDRVVVDPLITCRTRGYADTEWCSSCRGQIPAACQRAGEAGLLELGGEPLLRGNFVGFHRQLPGGWSRQMMVPLHQLYRVPDAVGDEQAVLTEPLAVATHAVIRSWERLGQHVLVIGSGPIALATVWALRALGFEGQIFAQMKRARESELAQQLGADVVVRPGQAVRDALLTLGGKPYKPIIGPEVYMGGFDCVFDCVGRSESLHQAVRMTAAGGQVGVLGCCTEVNRVDLTFLWARELNVQGFLAYGPEQWQGRGLHTFQLVLELLEQSRLPIQQLITHQYPLTDYKTALSQLYHRASSGALKVVLQPGG